MNIVSMQVSNYPNHSCLPLSIENNWLNPPSFFAPLHTRKYLHPLQQGFCSRQHQLCIDFLRSYYEYISSDKFSMRHYNYLPNVHPAYVIIDNCFMFFIKHIILKQGSVRLYMDEILRNKYMLWKLLHYKQYEKIDTHIII